MGRVVIDTSVIVAAFISREGTSYKIISLFLNDKLQNYISKEILDEYFRVLITKLIKYYPIELILEFYILLESKSEILNPKEKFSICRDKEDNKFLDVAYTSKVCCLITLDKDLLDLRNKNKELIINKLKLKILRPEEFLKTLED